MAVSTRHLHHQHLRPPCPGSGSDDDVFGGNGSASRPRGDVRQPPPPRPMKQSTAVLDALSDVNSDLARFLFVGAGRGGEQDGSPDDMERGRRLSWFRSLRHTSNAPRDEAEGRHSMLGMKTMDAHSYALALEPLQVRNERAIMLFEGE